MHQPSNHLGRKAIVAAVFVTIASLSQAGVAASSSGQNAANRMDSTTPSRPSADAIQTDTTATSAVRHEALGPYAAYLKHLGMNEQDAVQAARSTDARPATAHAKANSKSGSQVQTTSKAPRSATTPGTI